VGGITRGGGHLAARVATERGLVGEEPIEDGREGEHVALTLEAAPVEAKADRVALANAERGDDARPGDNGDGERARAASGTPSIRTQRSPLRWRREVAELVVVARNAMKVPDSVAAAASLAQIASAAARPPVGIQAAFDKNAMRPGAGTGVTGTPSSVPRQ